MLKISISYKDLVCTENDAERVVGALLALMEPDENGNMRHPRIELGDGDGFLSTMKHDEAKREAKAAIDDELNSAYANWRAAATERDVLKARLAQLEATAKAEG